MNRSHVGSAARRARQWVIRRVRRTADDGFILLESIIAITVITVVMSAVGAEFVGGLISTAQQRTQQTAVQLADSSVEQIRALHPTDLVTGRDSGSVLTQFQNAPAAVQAWLPSTSTDLAVDSKAAANSGLTAAVPTTGVVQKPANVSYTVNEYLYGCSIRTTGNTDCVPTSTLVSGTSAVAYLRAVVAVTWKSGHCGSSACVYVTSTLISTAGDPTFRINSAPYSAPAIVDPGAQTNALADQVSLQLTVQNGTGVPSFAWTVLSGTLPGGLAMSPTGLISGTVTGATGLFTATVGVTDSFTRSDTQTIAWTVVPALALTDPGPQANTTADTVNLTLQATGGVGGPYTFSDPTTSLPPGLALSSAGVVTGKATTVGNYSVVVKIGDSSGTRFKTGTFTWTIAYPPLAASNPGTQVATINRPITPALQLSASGGSGNYTWTDPTHSLPAGYSVSSAGLITGTATAIASPTVSLTVTDTSTGGTKTVSFTWQIVAAPSVTSPGNSTVTVGVALTYSLTTSCPNSPCTYALNNWPPGLAVSSSGVISGTVGGSPTTYPNASVGVTDADGATASTGPFTIVVKARPTVTAPATQTNTPGTSVSVPVTTTCANAPCSYSMSGAPTGLSINSSGVITGTVGGSAQTYSSVTVTASDANAAATTSAAFTWTVSASVSFTAALNNVGVTVDTATNIGNFDGNGNSYSKTALANVGVTSGGRFSVYTWPASAGTGVADNVVAAGQTIALGGAGNTLGFLVSGSWGSPSGTGTIKFTDGTTQSYTLAATDWQGAATGAAFTTGGYNHQNNGFNFSSTRVYNVAIALTAGKTVASVQLPTISAAVVSGVAAMHVWAMTVYASSLAASFNNIGVTAGTSVAGTGGNFDGGGNSYSKTGLASGGLNSGATVTSNGTSFVWPSAAGTGAADNTVVSGQTIAYTATATTLGFLMSAGYGPSSGTGSITYTDGTTQSFTLASPDWVSNTTPAFTATGGNGSANSGRTDYIFYAGVTLSAGKTIAAIQLPPTVTAGNLHIFSIGTK